MSDLGLFDFSGGRGQRSESFAFHLQEGATQRSLGDITPLVGGSMSSSGTRSLVRTLSLSLGVDDSEEIDFVTDRLRVTMLLGEQEWPLGKFLFTDAVRQDYVDPDTGRLFNLMTCQLTDQMSIVDTELETAFTCVLESPRSAMERLLGDLDFDVLIEDSPQEISNSWMAGTSRRTVLESLAELGGYLPPWFDNTGTLRAIQQFVPTVGNQDFDFDSQQTVIAESVTRSDSAIYAPNRIVVVSNGGNTYGGSSSEDNPVDPIDPGPMMAFCDVPSTAPHSVMHLGFVRPQVVEIQATSVSQCQAVADLRCLTQTVAEEVQLSTSIDPRHDAWNTIKFQDRRWLETGWSISLTPGGAMRHSLQRSYPPTPEILSGTAGQLVAGI